MRLSSVTVRVSHLLLDYGSTYGPGQATHNLTLYRHSSGALVFAAGTVQWSWGLDSVHDYDYDRLQITTRPTPARSFLSLSRWLISSAKRSVTRVLRSFASPRAAADRRLQQAMVNLLADMGSQPATLQAGLTAATAANDFTAPRSTIQTPVSGATLQTGAQVLITGNASDSGGQVWGVEVSTDGGNTWQSAVGQTSWSFAWIPAVSGSATIKSRAFDDSGNLGAPGPAVTVSVVGTPRVL
jgi:hypothetical protein